MKEITLFEEMINTDQGAEKVISICFDEAELLNIEAGDDVAIVLPRTIDYRNLDQITKDEVKSLLKTPISGILKKLSNKNTITIIKNNNSVEDEVKLLRKNSREYKNNQELLSYIQENIINYEKNKIN